MENFTIREIGTMYKNLLDKIEYEGESDEAILQAMEAIDDVLEKKADSYAVVIKKLDADVEMLKAEEARLSAKRRTIERHKAAMKENLEYTMNLSGTKKFKTDYYAFSIQKNAPSLDVAPDAVIPDQYYKVERTLQRRELLNAIKAGEEIAGVSLKQTESLRIR